MKQQWSRLKTIAGVAVLVFCLEISNISAQKRCASAKAQVTIPQSRTDSEAITPLSNTASDSINAEDEVLKEVKQYFEGRWKGDLNFYDALEYEIVIHANGRVRSIQGIGDISKRYLRLTQFLVPNTQLVRASKQEHIAWVILYSNGEVQVQVQGLP